MATKRYLPMERIPLTCFTSLNSPTTFFTASFLCSSFIGATLPPTTSATCATKPLSTYPNTNPLSKNEKNICIVLILWTCEFYYPKKMIGVVASQSHKLEDVIHSLWSNLRIKPKFHISIISLQINPNTSEIRRSFQQKKQRLNASSHQSFDNASWNFLIDHSYIIIIVNKA